MSTAMPQKSHFKLIAILLILVALFTVAIIYFGLVLRKPQMHTVQNISIDGIYLSTPKPINDFNLTDNKGKPFTQENLRGQWSMMFFGFTNCGYVCPTTLAELNKMYKILQKELPDYQLPQIILVSVDPERDTVKRMNEYVRSFNSSFIGARAEETETQALTKQLHISAIRMQGEGDSKDHYMINHSSEILLINPEAKVQAYLSFPPKADKMAKDYKLILSTTAV